MGFFGWLCAKCEKPVLCDTIARGYSWASKAVSVEPCGNNKGTYDGYGRLGAAENLADAREVRLVHQKCFKPIQRDFDEVSVSKSDPKQSYFYSRRDLFDLFGEPDRHELRVSDFACIVCKHLWRTKWDLSCPVCKSENVDPIMRGEVIYACSLCKDGFIYYNDEDSRAHKCRLCGKVEPGSLTHMNPYNVLEAIAWASKDSNE